jgi:hypothetical protein
MRSITVRNPDGKVSREATDIATIDRRQHARKLDVSAIRAVVQRLEHGALRQTTIF